MLKGIFDKIKFLNKLMDTKEVDISLKVEGNKIVSNEINFSQDLNICEINLDEFVGEYLIDNPDDKRIRKIANRIDSAVYNNNSNCFVFTMSRKHHLTKRMYNNAPLKSMELIVLDGQAYQTSKWNGLVKCPKSYVNSAIAWAIEILNRKLREDNYHGEERICPKCLVYKEFQFTSQYSGHLRCPKCGETWK